MFVVMPQESKDFYRKDNSLSRTKMASNKSSLKLILILLTVFLFSGSLYISEKYYSLKSSHNEILLSPGESLTPKTDNFLDTPAIPTGNMLKFSHGDKVSGVIACGSGELAEAEQKISNDRTIKSYLMPPNSCSDTNSKVCPPDSSICDENSCFCRKPRFSLECENSGGHCDEAIVHKKKQIGIGGCHIKGEDVVGSCQDKTAEFNQPYAGFGFYKISICCVLNSNPVENAKNQPPNTGVSRDPDVSYPLEVTEGDIPCGSFNAWRKQDENGQLTFEKERVCVEWSDFSCPIDKPVCNKDSCLCAGSLTADSPEEIVVKSKDPSTTETSQEETPGRDSSNTAVI